MTRQKLSEFKYLILSNEFIINKDFLSTLSLVKGSEFDAIKITTNRHVSVVGGVWKFFNCLKLNYFRICHSIVLRMARYNSSINLVINAKIIFRNQAQFQLTSQPSN